jgi:hypothetical protein
MLPALLLSLVLSADVPDAGLRSPFDGAWELDLKESSDVTPLLDLLDVSGPKRWMAPKVVSVQTIVVTRAQLSLTVRAGLTTRTVVYPLDGKTPVVDELFDHRTELVSQVVDGVVLSTGTIDVKGALVPMKVRRLIEGALMVQLSTFEPVGREPIRVRRVFVRKER